MKWNKQKIKYNIMGTTKIATDVAEWIACYLTLSLCVATSVAAAASAASTAVTLVYFTFRWVGGDYKRELCLR